jgi:hypothetical protein
MTDTLRSLQDCFQAHVLAGEQSMLAKISPDAKPSAAARLAIYANGYRLRLLEALSSDYPALLTLAGDELFEQIGRAYIDAHPSKHFSIRYFGQHLSAFLTATAPYSDTPALSEMAALEWSLSLSFDAADAAVITVETLAKLPPESWPELRLRFHPSVQRHYFHWNMPELWSAIDAQTEPQPPHQYTQPRVWLIWRRDLQNYFRPLKRVEAWALDSMRNGTAFAAVCEGLCAYIDAEQVGLHAAGLLKGWVQAGLVTEVYGFAGDTVVD